MFSFAIFRFVKASLWLLVAVNELNDFQQDSSGRPVFAFTMRATARERGIVKLYEDAFFFSVSSLKVLFTLYDLTLKFYF